LIKLFECNCHRAKATTLQLGPSPYLGEMALATEMVTTMANGDGDGDGDGDGQWQQQQQWPMAMATTMVDGNGKGNG
jgi:hypothetical protein